MTQRARSGGTRTVDQAISDCLAGGLLGGASGAGQRFGPNDARIEPVLDYMCLVGERREIYFLWRPFLRDPGDKMVLEVAVGAGVSTIVTHNVRDFAGVDEHFGIRVATPAEVLTELKEQ